MNIVKTVMNIVKGATVPVCGDNQDDDCRNDDHQGNGRDERNREHTYTPGEKNQYHCKFIPLKRLALGIWPRAWLASSSHLPCT